jgi:hypothetical protein
MKHESLSAVKIKIVEISAINIQNIQRFSNPHLLMVEIYQKTSKKTLHRQGTPNSVGGRKSMYQIQATETMKQ